MRSYPLLVADPTRTPQPGETPAPTLSGSTQSAPTPVQSGLSAVTGAVTGSKPRPEPLDPPMVPFTLAGLGAFVAAGLVMLLFRGRLSENGHSDWLWICVAGFLAGLVGLATMIRHDAHRRRRRALTHPEVREIPEVDET
jgi:hypothetical protein